MNTRKRIFSAILALTLIAGSLLLWTQEKVFAAEQAFTFTEETSYAVLKEGLSSNESLGAVKFNDDTKTISIDFQQIRFFTLDFRFSKNVLTEEAQDFINSLFSEAVNLQSVKLNRVNLGKIDFSNLDNKAYLERFEVIDCELQNIPDISLPYLRFMDMSDNDLSAADACAGLTGTNYPQLTDLTLFNCKLTEIPDASLSKLSILIISGNDFSGGNACNHLNSTNFPVLEAVYLDKCMISDVGGLSNIGSTLTALSLGRNYLTNDSLDSLIGMRDKFPNLRVLNLGGKVREGSGMIADSGASNTNTFTDTQKLASLLTTFPNIKNMDLSNLRITSLQDFSGVGDDITLYFNRNKIIDFAGLENRAHIYFDWQSITTPEKFSPGQEGELPELLKRILDPSDVLKGNMTYYNCKLSDDGTKLIINPNVGGASIKVTSGKLSNSTITIQLKKIPSYTIPRGLTATVGDTLAKVTLPEGFTWKDAAQDVGAEGTNTFEAVYTPQDTDEYATISVYIPVKVTNPDKPTEPATEPDKPTESPTEPDKPTESPTEPDKPTESPTEPTKPTESATEPTNPVEPTKPTEAATEPTNPVETTASEGLTEAPSDEYDADAEEDETEAVVAASSVKTSDTSPIVPVMVLLFVSGMVLCITVLNKKKTM